MRTRTVVRCSFLAILLSDHRESNSSWLRADRVCNPLSYCDCSGECLCNVREASENRTQYEYVERKARS